MQQRGSIINHARPTSRVGISPPIEWGINPINPLVVLTDESPDVKWHESINTINAIKCIAATKQMLRVFTAVANDVDTHCFVWL